MNQARSKQRPPLPDHPVLVVGLARSGAAVARLLAARDLRVRGVDSGRPEQAEGLAEAGVEVSLNVDGIEQLDGVATVVKSPGVPQDAPVVRAAREGGVEVIGELEVAWRALPNRFVGVTGTNGKTTVTELIGHLYRAAAEPVAVAGNVGTPLASLAGEVDAEATIVCECSSFQLEDSKAFSPECAVFLNLAPDHLDRHPSLEDYLEAKLRIFANQSADDVAVLNADEPAIAGRGLGGDAGELRFCPVDRSQEPEETRPGPLGPADPCDMSVESDEIRWRGEPLATAGELRMLGRHKVENAMAAATAVLAMGLDTESVHDGLASFEGVPHRLELVAEIGGVRFVNDSKATNVAAARSALESFDGVHAILGGSLKGEAFEGLAGTVAERCAACYLIGEAAEQLAADLAPVAERGIELHRSANLETAVRAAAGAAETGDVVLLAPACASFDAYANFEKRGEHFRALVKELR